MNRAERREYDSVLGRWERCGPVARTAFIAQALATYPTNDLLLMVDRILEKRGQKRDDVFVYQEGP